MAIHGYSKRAALGDGRPLRLARQTAVIVGRPLLERALTAPENKEIANRRRALAEFALAVAVRNKRLALAPQLG
jgi:hypothetical protein